MEISTIIAIISLIIAVTALMLNHLRPAKITTFLGPTVTLGHPIGGGLAINLPVTYSNRGAKTGSVFRAAVIICHKESPEERYFMQWDSFLKLEFQPIQWTHDELAHALAIPGKSIVAKNINFVWYPTSQPQIKFQKGLYDLEFLFWASDMTVPHCETHQIRITEQDLSIIEDSSDPENLQSVSFQLDKELEINKVMNEFGVRALRKQPPKELA